MTGLERPYPILPGRPHLPNCRLIDSSARPILSHMQDIGTALDIPVLKSLSVEMADVISDLDRQIRKHVAKERFAAWKTSAVTDTAPTDTNDEDTVDTAPDVDTLDTLYFNPDSSLQVGAFLYETLNLGATKDIKTTSDGKRKSTGKKELEKLKDEHEIVSLLLKYREYAKLKSTYVDKLPKLAILHRRTPGDSRCPICRYRHREDSYRIHTRFVTTRTETGRIASRSPNLQNIPVRTDLGRRVREAFIPTPGMVWISVDMSQIELRTLAGCSGDPVMSEVYRTGGDIHITTARRAFNLGPDDKVDKHLHRAPSKTVNFGVVYGMTGPGLFAQLILMFHQANLHVPDWLTSEWCDWFIEQWFGVYNRVRPYMKTQDYRADRYEMTWTLSGRIRYIPEVRSVHEYIVHAGHRQDGNIGIQGLAGDFNKIWLADIENDYDGGLLGELNANGIYVDPLLTVHDETNLEADPAYAEDINTMIKDLVPAMGERLGFPVPLKADGHVFDRWKKD